MRPPREREGDAMKRIAIPALGLCLGLLAVACGSKGAVVVDTPRPSGSPAAPGGPAPRTSPPRKPKATPTSTRPTSNQSFTYEVWFALGEHLFVAHRTEPFTVAVGETALTSLMAGPTATETSAGVGTLIPAGTEPRGLNMATGIATVDRSVQLE